jgi:glucosamine kinase
MTESSHEKLLLVLDGGGTRTRALVAPAPDPQAEALAQVEVGPTNFGQVREEGLASALNEIIAKLPKALREISALVVGLAGVGRKEERQKAESALRRLFPDIPLLVRTDAELAYHGAFGHESDGILIITGTGSIAWTRLTDGRFLRAGGWGALLGDEGGGTWMGREALRLCLREGETKELGLLSQAVLKTLQIPKAADILTLVYQRNWGPENWASLAPLVFEHAGQDEGADALIKKAGVALAELARRLLTVMPATPDPVPLAVAGGLSVHWPLLAPSFFDKLQRDISAKCELITPLGDALFGGRLIACDAGIP